MCHLLQKDATQVPMSLFVYVALDNEGQLSAEVRRNHLTAISGHTSGLGDFRITFPENNFTTLNNYLISYSPSLDGVKNVLASHLRLYSDNVSGKETRYIGLVGKAMPNGVSEAQANFIVYQVTVNYFTIFSIVLIVSFEHVHVYSEENICKGFFQHLTHFMNAPEQRLPW
jgi:hypothetical protein